MVERTVSNQTLDLMKVRQDLFTFIGSSRWAEHRSDPGACDFLLGNPHELPLQGMTEALKKWATPQNKDWFAYKMSEPGSQQVVAETLRAEHGIPFDPEDIAMTTGASAGLAVTLNTVLAPGEEVIYISPPWFFYESFILAAGGKPVRVACDPQTYDLDLNAIERAITPQTRAIIINSPNNPTGKIYSPETLQALAELLTAASRRQERPISLLSDESYYRIVFDGRKFWTPAAFYPHTFMIYTYGKVLLTPGQRIGWIAVPPNMPGREVVRQALQVRQMTAGYAFPNALLQYALPELQRLSIDIGRLQARRDRMGPALQEMGYEVNLPEGTFYMLVKSPITDETQFTELLASRDIYCLPGSMFEMPGFFRISLTANDEMVERALPGFEAALQAAQKLERAAL